MVFANYSVSVYNTDLNISGLEEIEVNEDIAIFPLPMPLWEIIVTIVALTIIIIFTIVGNVLVILSVFTYKPLRIVQNFFIVSLAVADLTIAVFVLPFNVAYSIIGKWVFGLHLCEMWLTCDILCCTASILNLCAIALDRYQAITDPINYAQKRTLNRVLGMIGLVWGVSLIICLPPLFGWNDWPEVFTPDTPCMLTQQKGFIIYSSMGSFFVPLSIMALVYIKIYLATRRRLRERAAACKINALNPGRIKIAKDEDSQISDNGHNGYTENSKKNLVEKPKKKKKDKKKNLTKTDSKSLCPPPVAETSLTENDHDESEQSEEYKKLPVMNHAPPPPQAKSQVYQFIEQKQKISLSKERRAARTLGIIMGSFMVCWLPFFIMYVILPFCSSCTVPNDKVINFITWLGYINSSLNPVIYTIFNIDFRRAFTRILKC
ncbi:unnamed protein product, partial [Meganyctiphanes norvegica]